MLLFLVKVFVSFSHFVNNRWGLYRDETSISIQAARIPQRSLHIVKFKFTGYNYQLQFSRKSVRKGWVRSGDSIVYCFIARTEPTSTNKHIAPANTATHN